MNLAAHIVILAAGEGREELVILAAGVDPRRVTPLRDRHVAGVTRSSPNVQSGKDPVILIEGVEREELVILAAGVDREEFVILAGGVDPRRVTLLRNRHVAGVTGLSVSVPLMWFAHHMN